MPGLLGPISPCSAPSLLPTPEPSLSLFRGLGPRRGGAGGDGREFPSDRIVVGASCGGVSGDPEHRRGSRDGKCAGLSSGRAAAGWGLAGPVSPWLSVAVSGRVSVGTGGVASIKAKALRLKVGRA